MSQTTNPRAPLKLAQIPSKGRALISTEPLKAGQIVLKDSPLLLYSALPLPHNYCLNCFHTLPQFPSNCPNNPSHQFCSPNCLTNSHSSWACNKLTNLQHYYNNNNNTNKTILTHQQDTQCQLNYLVAAYNLAVTGSEKFRLLLELDGGVVTEEDFRVAGLMHSVLVGVGVEGFTVEMTAGLLGRDKRNAFGLMEGWSESGVRSVRAYGVYRMASFFNHDCLPNACRFDYVDGVGEGNTDIVVRMIHGVEEGREVCLSYFPVDERYASRQKRLREDYGFVCDCDRCKVEANWSDDEGEGEGEEEDGMEEDDQMVGSEENVGGGDEGESDFPHAYFFARYMCSRDNCGGTLAPLPPSEDGALSDIMECNVCGNLKNADEDINGEGGEASNLMDE